MCKLSVIIPEHITNYCRAMCVQEHPAQTKLREATNAAKGLRSVMLSSPEQQQLLQLVLRLMGAKKVLDIGVFTGYSSLSMALAIPDDGKGKFFCHKKR